MWLLGGPAGWGEFCPFEDYDDAASVRVVQRIGELLEDRQRLGEREPSDRGSCTVTIAAIINPISSLALFSTQVIGEADRVLPALTVATPLILWAGRRFPVASWKGAPQFEDKDAGWSFKPRGRLMYDFATVSSPASSRSRICPSSRAHRSNSRASFGHSFTRASVSPSSF